MILGYTMTQEIYSGSKHMIYRGLREEDQKPVIIKTFLNKFPSSIDLANLKREFEIIRNLRNDIIVKAYALETHGNSLALILEDIGGEPLKNYIGTKEIDLQTFLNIALKLSETLGELHQNRIIHKDIKPHNIIVNLQTNQVRLIDFSISSRTPHENPKISHPSSLEGTLAYMSPEQTGRMNRAIDYRTDFYSLGVTCYEMLTGKLLFYSEDPLELVHWHIANIPLSPAEINPDIPQTVSDIVMKLLSKTAEERYQSGFGLMADLQECLHQLKSKGKIEALVPGQHDISDRFEIPQKLYGREEEIETLMAAFDRVSQGTTEMLLVSGYSGIGKTSLIHEIHKPIVRQKGYFISGKFDQFNRNIPYNAIIQAFGELVQQILTESKEDIQLWKNNLTEALGSNGQVIIDMIPELELIVGEQPPVPHLGPIESQNRFNLYFQKFVQVFANEEHSLALFLDDLQWADLASLNLIQTLVTGANAGGLFLIAAFRDNEVDSHHPLLITLDEIKNTGTVINEISLGPLSMQSVNQLMADTLSCPHERVEPLAKRVYQKTEGNPFYLKAFLHSFYDENLLHFDPTKGWSWEMEKINQMRATDNVVELMVKKISRLSPHTQEVLKLAACIGNRFHPQTLAIVREQSEEEIASQLLACAAEDLVVQLDSGYEFYHDRIQQAAYALIPEEDKRRVHYQIGKLLLKSTNEDQLANKIFDIVNQLNFGVELIADQTEKYNLAKLNLTAGKKAKQSAAYEPALKYLTTGIELLDKNSWQTQYDLTLALYVETAEAAYLSTKYNQMETLADIVLNHARTHLDQVKVYEIRIQAYTSQHKLLEALEIARQVLNLLDVSLPEKPTEADIKAGMIETQSILGDKSIEALKALPEMNEPSKLAAMRILSSAISAAVMAAPALLPLVIFKMVNLSVRYGNSSFSPCGYGAYGMILCWPIGDIDSAYQFGQLGLDLVDKFNAKEHQAKVTVVFHGVTQHWKVHGRETLAALLEGYQSGMETGDLEYAALCALFYSYNSLFVGRELVFLEKEMAKYSHAMRKLRQERHFRENEELRQLVLNLIGRSAHKTQLIGESFNEEEMLPVFIRFNDRSAISAYYMCKTMLCYVFDDSAQSLENAKMATNYLDASVGEIITPNYYFYYALALLAHGSDAKIAGQKEYVSQADEIREKLKNWAAHAPMNFSHKIYLVEAERARVFGQDLKAMECYDLAITAAKENEYIHEEALANELAAKFYLAKGRERVAKVYLEDARYGYLKWGAAAKVGQLEESYPRLLAQPVSETRVAKGVTATSESSTGTGWAELDLTSVLKAAQALSSEIVLDRLLSKMMGILIENAGAQEGCLVLNTNDNLVVNIEAEVDINTELICTLRQMPVEKDKDIPASAVYYVARTRETVVLEDAATYGLFISDPYIKRKQVKSLLVAPIVNQARLLGIIHLENNLIPGAFTPNRLAVLKLLSSQIAISLENAQLYAQLEAHSRTLEERVKARTQDLENTLRQLKTTQNQLILQEKMASLGALTAGIAHEIKNPLNFVNNFAELSTGLIQELLEEIQTHKEKLDDETVEAIADILSHLQQNTTKINEHGQRANSIVNSMLLHSRGKSGDQQPTDINALLAEDINLAYHGMRAKETTFNIRIETDYDESIERIEIVPQDISRVFLNIINNACYATHQKKKAVGEGFTPILSVRTKDGGHQVEIHIRDNGSGIPKDVADKIFNPFFTTKPTGEGTGLGLSISYEIVVEEHNGGIQVETEAGSYTEFIITLPIPRGGQ